MIIWFKHLSGTKRYAQLLTQLQITLHECHSAPHNNGKTEKIEIKTTMTNYVQLTSNVKIHKMIRTQISNNMISNRHHHYMKSLIW